MMLYQFFLAYNLPSYLRIQFVNFRESAFLKCVAPFTIPSGVCVGASALPGSCVLGSEDGSEDGSSPALLSYENPEIVNSISIVDVGAL